MVGHSFGWTGASPRRRCGQTFAPPRVPVRGTSDPRADLFVQQTADEADMLNPDYPKALSQKDVRGGSGRSGSAKGLTRFHLSADCDEATATAAFLRLRPRVRCALQGPVFTNCVAPRCRHDLHGVQRRTGPGVVEADRASGLAEKKAKRTFSRRQK